MKRITYFEYNADGSALRLMTSSFHNDDATATNRYTLNFPEFNNTPRFYNLCAVRGLGAANGNIEVRNDYLASSIFNAPSYAYTTENENTFQGGVEISRTNQNYCRDYRCRGQSLVPFGCTFRYTYYSSIPEDYTMQVYFVEDDWES